MRNRILLIAILCGALVAPVIAWQSTATTTIANSGLVLEIMARRYSADGRLQGTAGDHGAGAFDGFAYATASGCGLGAGDTAPTTVPAVGWRFNGRVLGETSGATGPQLAVRIEWERMWDKGAALSGGPRGTHTLTMSPGNSVVLDRATPQSIGSCQAAEARLEASVLARSAPAAGRGGRGRGTTMTTGTGGGVGRGVSSTGVQAGSGVGRGGVAGRGVASTTTGVDTPRTVVRSGTVTTVGRGGRASGMGAGRGAGLSMTGAQFDAEIWLVHQQPQGPELVQQQTIRFGGNGTDISFPPVTINTSRGIVNVDISGRLQVTDAPANTIDVTVSRRARAAGSPPLDTTGWSKVAVQVTNPSEVLSFEFPPLQKATEDLLSGHKFSLRLRLNGAK